ncbi:arsinothricin resistance N-acetyltransferase ArsN1 family B [Poritiphilus flavus]|uniref:GNAT family N-acetyltransferase n=1 Tax=Poritiphilus flavus TaxID=2697053 RepID=A0A6L9E924_9FLAO|nr:arsinothricin resistance N-acetyltransferase ArsN1 family B [Poritiphilus flavus]NAS11250.1 GNAT family N-acetyltransferase [Poritiphilus flavus]
MIRTVVRADADDIAAIYNHYIKNDIATFEEEPVTAADIERRISAVVPELPWLVYEDSGSIMGYAYASKWNPRSAYRYSVESTVYLKADVKGKGIGSQLYSALLQKLKAQNIRMVIGGISLPNAASQRLHEKFGYEKVAHFKEVGYKFGRWIDVGYWQLSIHESG